MKVSEALAELRTSRLDDAVAPYLWSDVELIDTFLNDAVRQVCLRQRALTESVNATVCQYPLAVGQKAVTLHPSIIAVRTARVIDTVETCKHEPLQGVTARWMAKRCPYWETSDPCTAKYWIPDYQEGQILLDRPAEVDGTLQLTVWRAPLDTELLSAAKPDGIPVVNPLWHSDLLDWVEYRAFSKPDADAEASNRAAQAEARFTAKIGRLPSATEVRLWGVSRLVGVPAEFL